MPSLRLLLLLIAIFFCVAVFAQDLPSGILAIQQAYTPQVGSCPHDFQLVRAAGTALNQVLGAEESAYISARDSDVLPGAWEAYLQNVIRSIAGTTALPTYVSNILSSQGSLPRLGIAVSGGGYRAAIFGAGVLNAIDGRNESSESTGTGGLLQAATYLSSLSGSSWLVSSVIQSNFPDISTLIFGPSSSAPTEYGGWNAEFDVLQPADSEEGNTEYLEGIITEIAGKLAAGFPVTITDVWARLLGRHFVNGTHAQTFFNDTESTHGASILLSGLSELSCFKNHEVPFPIITAESVSSKENTSTIIPSDSMPVTNTIFEFTPFEMGSFDPMLSAFTPTRFLGTTNTSTCVTNFDQLAYIFGTSSQLFNEFNTSATALANSPVGPFFSLLEQALPQPSSIELDHSLFPNAFFGFSPSTFIDSDQDFLHLVDGGEDREVLPLQPLLVKARAVDVILAVDASSDTTDNFAGGLALIATQNRTSFFHSVYSFPRVPKTSEEFISEGLTRRPTFFGCNDTSPTPLVIYLANGAPPPGQVAMTNTSTLQTTYSRAELQAMLDQALIIATQGFPDSNSSQTFDPEWPACLACAVVDRMRENIERSGVCETCFARYCWSP